MLISEGQIQHQVTVAEFQLTDFSNKCSFFKNKKRRQNHKNHLPNKADSKVMLISEGQIQNQVTVAEFQLTDFSNKCSFFRLLVTQESILWDLTTMKSNREERSKRRVWEGNSVA